MMTRRAVLAALAVTPFLARPAFAGRSEVFVADGLAIGGMDPLGYVREGRAVAGQAAFALMWKDAVWHFATAANRDLFEMNPKAHAPQYGGYCAYALAQGALTASDPEVFTVLGGRIYLNESAAIRDRWLADAAMHIETADARWPEILR